MSFEIKLGRHHSLSFTASGTGSSSPRVRAKVTRLTSKEREKRRKRSNTIDFGNLSVNSSFKILQIQEKFPHDNLRLTESPDSPTQRMKALSNRRRSAPNAVINKILNKSSSNLSIDGNNRPSSPSPTSPSTPVEAKPRTYIQEGCVQLSTGVSIQTRYLFLFNDILLVAKSKSVSTYKLKSKVRISEMWLGTCIDEVTESTVSPEKSFVIGWPTTNYVASFSTSEEKELWWTSLRKYIQDQRDLEDRKDITLKICKRDMEDSSVITKSLPVSVYDDVKAVTKMALENFHLSNENSSEYQLWVISGKENAAYPLIGHEIPFAIKMNHIREAFIESSERSINNNLENGSSLEELSHEVKCEFILKKARKGGARINLDIPSAQKRWRNPMKKSPIMNWAMNKKSGKGHLSQDLITPGKLFGLPLTSLTTNEELVPKPVEDILIQLFKKGPSTVGIFRKSGLMKTMKQVRQALNEGLPVELEDKSAVLLSTILKEFFRSLPDCIFGSEFYEEFVATREIQDTTTRSEEIKKILNKLPKPNQEVIKRFFCLAYHIAKYSERNSMTASNLAVCIAPSLIWPPGQERLMSPETTGSASEFVAFVIENFIAIYGEESLTLLGLESEILLDTPLPEEEPESTGEQVIFHCQQGDEKSSKRVPELRTSISYGGEYRGMQDEDDHSSDERLNLNNSLNMTSVSLIPGEIGDSKSSPSSPFASRKQSPIIGRKLMGSDFKPTENGFMDDMTTIRRHSDQDLSEESIATRRGPKYTRVKRTLISTTTSAELIEHRRPFQDDSSPRLGIRNAPHGGSSPQTVRVVSPASTSPRSKPGHSEQSRPGNHRTFFPAGGESTYLDPTLETPEKLSGSTLMPRSTTGGSNHGSETSSLDGRGSPGRSPLSSPVLRRRMQGGEGRSAQADIVMQNFYRRQQPAAPSYDEHIQRRQLWQRQGHTQRLGSDSGSDKPSSGRSDTSPVEKSDFAPFSTKMELQLDSSDKKICKGDSDAKSPTSEFGTTFNKKINKGDSDAKSPTLEFGTAFNKKICKGDSDAKSPTSEFGTSFTNEREIEKLQPSIDRDSGKKYRSTENEAPLANKPSPRLQAKKLETELKNSSDSSIYSRFTGDNTGGVGRSQARVLSRPVFENYCKTDLHSYNTKNSNLNPVTSSPNSEGLNVTQGGPSVGRYTGIPVKSNLAHFPTSDFFPKEAKAGLKSSDQFSQSPWFKEEALRKHGKEVEKPDERIREVINNNTKLDRDARSPVLTRNIVGGDLSSLDVHAIPHLTEAETPTLEDFQNFMFQDESRV